MLLVYEFKGEIRVGYDIYCDESGNTGTNFFDDKQPIYVISGWLIERNNSYRIKSFIENIRKAKFPQSEELKGAKLLKNPKGRNFCVELIREMGSKGATPFFIIAEKRFCIAAKIVEAFFDPYYNEKLQNDFSWRNDLKITIAEIIYTVSLDSIRLFNHMHQNPTIENITTLKIQLVKDFREYGYSELADIVEGTNNKLEMILDEETHTAVAMEKKALATLNLPVFVSFIQLIEKFSRATDIKNVRLIHDEVAQFKKAFPEVFEIFNKKKIMVMDLSL